MLNTCAKDGCCPVEQTRGEMGPGDYFDVIANNKPGFPGGVPEPEKYGHPLRYGEAIPEGVRAEHCVEADDSMNENFRVCCKTCGKATPWGTQDIPGMPGAGADWMRKHWNETVGK